jgi:pSer/pThr/pTyr-binding forkhead associated (FHA) protein
MKSIKVKCSKCGNIVSIIESKIPKNKKKASVKCSKCQKLIVFEIPDAKIPEGEKTEIGDTKNLRFQNAKLVEKSNGKEHILKVGKNIIGRKCDITIENDRYIGRKHCLIEMKKQDWGIELIISDDGSETEKVSTNGTFYKEKKLSQFDKIVLNSGDEIRIGRTILTIVFW